jgi:hypothetical protein
MSTTTPEDGLSRRTILAAIPAFAFGLESNPLHFSTREIEEAFIGGVWAHRDTLPQWLHLPTAAFTDSRLQLFWGLIREVYHQGMDMRQAVVGVYLAATPRLWDGVGGWPYYEHLSTRAAPKTRIPRLAQELMSLAIQVREGRYKRRVTELWPGAVRPRSAWLTVALNARRGVGKSGFGTL